MYVESDRDCVSGPVKMISQLNKSASYAHFYHTENWKPLKLIGPQEFWMKIQISKFQANQ